MISIRILQLQESFNRIRLIQKTFIGELPQFLLQHLFDPNFSRAVVFTGYRHQKGFEFLIDDAEFHALWSRRNNKGSVRVFSQFPITSLKFSITSNIQ